MPLLDDPWLPAPDSNGVIPAWRPGAPVGVYRFDGTSTFFGLPNVECLAVEHREGTDPGHAAFRYNLASGLDGAPASIEQALGTGFSGAYTVNPGDRLVVQAMRPDGVVENLFDGICTSFGMGVDPGSEEVVIQAVGIAWHAWDKPIAGAIMRGSDNPKRIDDTKTDLIAHFNPDGLPNCIPDDYMAGTQDENGDFRYPTFLDEKVIRTPDQRTYWTLAKAARYLLFTANAPPIDAPPFVLNPDGAYLDLLLNTAGNPTNSGGKPATVPDTPVTGKDWPSTLYRLVTEVGVGQHFKLGSDDSGNPVTALALFPQQGGDVKHLYLAPRGTAFSPTLFNVAVSSLHRDVSEVVNSVTVKGALGRVETTIVLACGFPGQASDVASATTLAKFDKGDPTFLTDNRDKYRLYVFGETGDGYYDPGTTTKLTGVTKLDALYGFAPTDDGKSQYVFRRRRALECLSLDPAKVPYRPRLAISTDYAGTSPGIWDGTGTWQPVTSTTWEVLEDRIGIRITDKNPEDWEIGKSSDPTMPYPGGVVRAISAQSGAAGAPPKFYLRLTCSLESDLALRQTVSIATSPLPQAISRTIDASDRYRLDAIDKTSEFAKLDTTFNQKFTTWVRDDRKAAKAEATALVQASAFGVLDGPVTVPRLTTYYKVGDRIDSIDGRGLGLRTDDGTGDPIYPVVVGVRHEFSGDSQVTHLDISDAGSDRRRYLRPTKKRKAEKVSVPMSVMGGGAPGGAGGAGGAAPKSYTTNKTLGSGPGGTGMAG